jgi:alpha-galactosidase
MPSLVDLDKEGSVMLNPVGYVNYGRISLDTGHTFDASREAAPGIAARYFMNRNYFVADPDAFTVSTQTIEDHPWHESSKPATMDEARVSIALAAVSGGMFEIGDDLPSLSKTP